MAGPRPREQLLGGRSAPTSWSCFRTSNRGRDRSSVVSCITFCRCTQRRSRLSWSWARKCSWRVRAQLDRSARFSSYDEACAQPSTFLRSASLPLLARARLWRTASLPTWISTTTRSHRAAAVLPSVCEESSSRQGLQHEGLLLVEKLLADFTLAENGRRVARQVSSARPHDSRASSSSCGAE